jgi:hypothetical protein
MLLFVDESGHDHKHMPCEVLAGVAISEDRLWTLIKAIRAAEKAHFGAFLRELRSTEVKANRLLKRKQFRRALCSIQIEEAELCSLANAALTKGKKAHLLHASQSEADFRELVAYSRMLLRFVHEVLDLAAQHDVRVFAAVVDIDAPRPPVGRLRKDYVYLFERYFHFLQDLQGVKANARGLIVFDELEKSQAHILLQQMAAYFLGTANGRFRSSLVVPEPFFVHSELTTGVFLADIVAYVLGWAWRLQKMKQIAREELKPFANKIHEMQYRGFKLDPQTDETWPLYGIFYLDDLRGRSDREETYLNSSFEE